MLIVTLDNTTYPYALSVEVNLLLQEIKIVYFPHALEDVNDLSKVQTKTVNLNKLSTLIIWEHENE